MKRTNPALIVAPVLGLAAAVSVAIATMGSGLRAEPTRASASASASAAPPPPSIKGSEIPKERTDRPGGGYWKDTPLVSLTRVVDAFNRPTTAELKPCTARIIREWLRVECRNRTGVSLTAGDPKEVRTWVSGNPIGWNEAANAPNESLALIELPLVRGASYVVTFLGLHHEYEGALIDEADTLHISWREGTPDPVLLMTGPSPNQTF